MAAVYTVTEINSYIKKLFMRDYALSNICIKGEVSNLKYHGSGHIYFTLKDENAAINAVMFASRREGLTFVMREGQSVEVRGQITVYEKTGTYQLYAREIKLSGRGELYERFEKLKKELFEMGMFDDIYKKPIPKYALRIGIVTSETGAAIRDIQNIAARRNPYVQLYLYPALVQGRDAKDSIVRGIRKLDAMGLDLLIVGRGGGSIEDLWAFNEEEVARAVFEADTPVISAVGHETDTTITDFVADMRAPTPSAAAELAVFEYSAFSEEISALESELKRCMNSKLDRLKAELSQRALYLSAKSPLKRIEEKKRRIEDAGRRLLLLLSARVSKERAELDSRRAYMAQVMERRLSEDRNRLLLSSKQLELLSPLTRITGGYGYIESGEKRPVSSVKDVSKGDRIRTYVKDGAIESLVESAKKLSIQRVKGG